MTSAFSMLKKYRIYVKNHFKRNLTLAVICRKLWTSVIANKTDIKHISFLCLAFWPRRLPDTTPLFLDPAGSALAGLGKKGQAKLALNFLTFCSKYYWLAPIWHSKQKQVELRSLKNRFPPRIARSSQVSPTLLHPLNATIHLVVCSLSAIAESKQ